MSPRYEKSKRKGERMQIKSRMLLVIIILCLVVGFFVAPGIAAQDVSRDIALPRSFQGVSLGMPLSEFIAVVPDAKRTALSRRDQSQRTVVVPSKDRFLQRVEYRFYDDRLRELTIHYHHGQVPGGYQRMLARLKEHYGQPFLADQQEEYGLGSNVITVKKTTWKDRTTMSSLAESHRIIDDKPELALTITDLALQQAFVEEQEHRRRQRELSVPIPLPDHQNRQAAAPGLDLTRNDHDRG
jgi:hypothetical protein